MSIKVRTESDGDNVFQSWMGEYDWSRLKHCCLTNSFCDPGQWMVVCDVGNGPGMRFYFDSQARAMVFVQRWMQCVHDRTPQPIFNAWDAQVGWYHPTYEADQIRSLQKSLIARADELKHALQQAEQ